MNNITATDYHAQTNGRAKRYSSTIVSRLPHYVSDHETDWDTYLFPLTYPYNVQVQISITVSPFSLTLTRTPPGPAALVPKRTSLTFDNDAASALYARLELIRCAYSLREETDKSLNLSQQKYRRHHDHHVRLADIFNKGDKDYLDRPSLFHSTAAKSATERYNKLLSKKQGPYMVVCVNENMLRILKYMLQSTVCIHRATLATNSRRYSSRS